jgi:hypothetical protein
VRWRAEISAKSGWSVHRHGSVQWCPQTWQSFLTPIAQPTQCLATPGHGFTSRDTRAEVVGIVAWNGWLGCVIGIY